MSINTSEQLFFLNLSNLSITNPSKARITNRARYGMLWHANYESQGATTTSIQALAPWETMVDPT